MKLKVKFMKNNKEKEKIPSSVIFKWPFHFRFLSTSISNADCIWIKLTYLNLMSVKLKSGMTFNGPFGETIYLTINF